MITLKRKTTAPVIETRDGVEHPDIILNMNVITIDLVNKNMMIQLNYFHNQAARDQGHQPLNPNVLSSSRISFNFTPDSSPDFTTVYNMFSVDTENNVTMANPDNVANWILNRLDPMHQGVALNENWEIPV